MPSSNASTGISGEIKTEIKRIQENTILFFVLIIVGLIFEKIRKKTSINICRPESNAKASRCFDSLYNEFVVLESARKLCKFGRFRRKKASRVDRLFAEPQLKVKMGAGRTPGRSDITDQLSARDRLADLDLDPREVSIACEQAIAMIDLDHISIAAFPACFGHRSGRRSDHSVATLTVDVHSGVKLV